MIDLGSTKNQIVAAMASLPDRISPARRTSDVRAGNIGAGCSHTRSVSQVFIRAHAARSDTGDDTGCGAAIDRCDQRACTLILDPERHDQLAATISHVPYLASVALVEAALQRATMTPRG
ncbi:MAG: hypothetical protein MZV65_47285 [Chromatiales bacterium]|nr:hypothetical protein [Chromatiales bacterium]